MKKYFLLTILLFVIVLTASCTKINKRSYYKIVAGDVDDGSLLSEVVNYLGEPHEIAMLKPDFYHNCYIWFDNASSLEEAKEKASQGKKVFYIEIITNLNSDTYTYVVAKDCGYITENFEIGDIEIYAKS